MSAIATLANDSQRHKYTICRRPSRILSAFQMANTSRYARAFTMTARAGITANASISIFNFGTVRTRGRSSACICGRAYTQQATSIAPGQSPAGGPPRSRNTKMSARVFVGKLFRVLTTTVKPRHRIAGEDGKSRPGPFLPEAFWYSKVLCILALEATNEKIGPITTLNTTEEESDATLHSPVNVTNSSSNPFSQSDLSEGEVGRRELGDGSKRGSTDFAIRDEHHHNAPPLAGEGEAISSPASSPRDCVTPQSREYHGDVKRQKEILRARGFLP